MGQVVLCVRQPKVVVIIDDLRLTELSKSTDRASVGLVDFEVSFW